MRLSQLRTTLAASLVAAVLGYVGRQAGDDARSTRSVDVSASTCKRTDHEPAPQSQLPPLPNTSIEALALPNQLAVLPEYIGLFPN